MGTDKALIRINGVPIIQRVYTVLSAIFPNLLLITNHPERYAFLPCPTVPDIYRNAGSLAGLHAALFNARTELVFVVACDMPFLRQESIRYLCTKIDRHDAAVPASRYGLEPLHAVYRRSCLPVAEAMLACNEKRIRDFLARINTCIIPYEELSHLPDIEASFINVNTPRELTLAETQHTHKIQL